jgi:hypothetical protein
MGDQFVLKLADNNNTAVSFAGNNLYCKQHVLLLSTHNYIMLN